MSTTNEPDLKKEFDLSRATISIDNGMLRLEIPLWDGEDPISAEEPVSVDNPPDPVDPPPVDDRAESPPEPLPDESLRAWEELPVNVIQPSAASLKIMLEHDVKTLGQLVQAACGEFEGMPGGLTNMNGIGPQAERNILRALRKWCYNNQIPSPIKAA